MPTIRLPAALGAAWAVLVVANYAPGHLPGVDPYLRLVGAPLLSLTWGQVGHVIARAGAAAALLLLQLAAAAWTGSRILRWIGGGPDRRDAVIFAPLLGLGVIGTIPLGAGLCGLYGAGLYAFLLGIPAVLALRNRSGLRGVAAAWRTAAAARPTAWLGAALAAAVFVLAASLVSGLTPPHVSDEMVYHLGLARWYLRHHRVIVQPGNLLAAFPHLDTLLYGAGEAFGLGAGLKWIHAAAGGLALAGVWRLTDGAGPRARWLAVLGLATCPIVWTMAGRAYSDVFLMACGAAAVLAARRGNGRLAGLCVGLAGSFKYTGLLTGLLVVPLLPLRAVLPALATAVLTASPWLVRNHLVFGNPVHPLLWRLFREPDWDGPLAWRLRQEAQPGDPSFRDLVFRLPALPWLLPVRGLGAGTDGSTGILLALGLPVLAFACRWRETVALAAFALPNVAGAAGIRLLLPALPLAAAVMARGADGWLARARVPWLVLAAGLVWWQAAEFVPGAWSEYDDPLPVVFGQEPVDRYLDRMRYPRVYFPRPSTWVDRAAAEDTPPDARILFIGGFGGAYGIPRWCVFTPIQGRPLPVTWARECRDDAGIAKRVRQLGITHVLVNRWLGDVYLDYWRFWDWGPPGTVNRWIAFWDRHAVPVAESGRHLALFHLSRAAAAGPHRLTPGFESEVVRLGIVLVSRRRVDEAARIFSDIATTFPGNPEVWMVLGMAQAARGRLAEAEACARRAAALAPGSPADLRVRAAICAARGRLAEAARLLEPAAQRLGDDPYAWLDLSMLELRLGRTSALWRAEREFRRTRDYVNGR